MYTRRIWDVSSSQPEVHVKPIGEWIKYLNEGVELVNLETSFFLFLVAVSIREGGHIIADIFAERYSDGLAAAFTRNGGNPQQEQHQPHLKVPLWEELREKDRSRKGNIGVINGKVRKSEVSAECAEPRCIRLPHKLRWTQGRPG